MAVVVTANVRSLVSLDRQNSLQEAYNNRTSRWNRVCRSWDRVDVVSFRPVSANTRPPDLLSPFPMALAAAVPQIAQVVAGMEQLQAALQVLLIGRPLNLEACRTETIDHHGFQSGQYGTQIIKN
jgi:hypothetical protein